MRARAPGKLLATVAASAASVTSAGVVAAHAEDAKITDPSVIDSRVKIAFEGAFFQNNVHQDDKTGGTDKLGNSNGDFSGSVALTKQISSDMVCGNRLEEAWRPRSLTVAAILGAHEKAYAKNL